MARRKGCYIKRTKPGRRCYCNGKPRKLASCGVKKRKKLPKKAHCKPGTTRTVNRRRICTTRGGGTRFVGRRRRR